MSLPSAVKSVIGAGAKRVTVVVKDTAYAIEKESAESAAEVNQIAAMAQQLAETNTLMRSILMNRDMVETVQRVLTDMAKTMEALRTELIIVHEGQQEIVKELRKTVVPKYDAKTGRLISAKREG